MVKRMFDAIHEFHGSFQMSPDSTLADFATHIPILWNDDALGDPMSLNVHPEHASWAEIPNGNCYPDSSIHNLRIQLDIIAPEAVGAAVAGLQVEYGLITNAFPEDLDAKDEKSGLTIKTILELATESTDRQCYPLYNTVKVQNASTMPAGNPGLTAGQVLEAIAWDSEIVKDQLRYGQVRQLLRKFLPIGIRKEYIKFPGDNGVYRKKTFNFLPKRVKFINPYTALMLFIKMTQADDDFNTHDPTLHQPVSSGDLSSDATDLLFSYHVSFRERNPEFHMAKI